MNKLNPGQPLQLSRDCTAILVPSAKRVCLPQGTVVNLHQVLGSNVTVVVEGNLARIEEEDADALGITLPSNKRKSTPAKQKTPKGFVNLDDIWDALKTCYDPEIPVNIVDLGLIYECKTINNTSGFGSDIYIQMTLTAPGCSMGPILVEDIKKKLILLENVLDLKVELTFDPPWSSEMVSESGKLSLGIL